MSQSAFFESPVAQIIVGHGLNQRTFHVHTHLLEQHSEYFKVSLNSAFPEGQTKQVTLHEDNADAFHLFVQWIYGGDYNVKEARGVEYRSTEDTYSCHAEAYTLGNKLIAPAFKIHTVKRLLKVLETFDGLSMTTLLDMVQTVYAGTSEEDGYDMRLALAHYCVSRIGKGRPIPGVSGFYANEIDELAQTNNTSFLRDVLLLIPPGPRFSARDLEVQLYVDQVWNNRAPGG
ncbi:MAG: hypothetical protein FRX48_01730 [Lasallia pustulata]|uniref:BTB domain-containing protein n=1 Tax=Lasallia pustulata TaxID=136370 RepID=A0A5M8PYV1_9LECA|nr:MAG: hypothetical protein FRX48_01730 [Lasallia pustulata]